MEKLLCVLLLVLPIITQGATDSWSYDGQHGHAPDAWGSYNPTCDMTRQSPIDLDASRTKFDSTLDEFVFTGYDSADFAGGSSPVYLNAENNGHSVSLSRADPNTGDAWITGGGLELAYNFTQMHLHWGSVNTRGSEHTIDEEAYAAELHFVHTRSDFAAISDALQDSSGLAVLGMFVEVDDAAESGFGEWVAALSNVSHAGDEATIKAFPLEQLLPKNRTGFYRYEGSLTTPPCSEAVIWTVFMEPITMTTAQMNAFRALYAEDVNTTIVDNYRPLQPFNGRTIKTSVPFTSRASHLFSGVILIIIATFCVMSA